MGSGLTELGDLLRKRTWEQVLRWHPGRIPFDDRLEREASAVSEYLCPKGLQTGTEK